MPMLTLAILDALTGLFQFFSYPLNEVGSKDSFVVFFAWEAFAVGTCD